MLLSPNRLKRWTLLPTLLLVACVSHQGLPVDAVAETPPPQKTEYRVLENLRYSPDDWPQALHANVYLPKSEGPHPAVLVVHGGGWARRSPADMVGISKFFAARGFVAVNVAYRLAPEHQFPAQLHDLQQAMHWLHAEAERFNIDRERIAAMGYSAGAHLVSLLAVVAGSDDELDKPYGGKRTRPAAVIAGGTPSDLRKFEGGELVPQFLGGGITEIPEVYAAASPVTHIGASAPPFFIYHGGSDLLVGADHARDFYEDLRAADVPAELYMMTLHGHITAFFNSRMALKDALPFLHRAMPSRAPL